LVYRVVLKKLSSGRGDGREPYLFAYPFQIDKKPGYDLFQSIIIIKIYAVLTWAKQIRIPITTFNGSLI